MTTSESDNVIKLSKHDRERFHHEFGWMFLSGEAEVPDEWLQYLVPLCELVNDVVPENRRNDFKIDVYCDRGDYPIAVDIILEPSDIEMAPIQKSIEHVVEIVRNKYL